MFLIQTIKRSCDNLKQDQSDFSKNKYLLFQDKRKYSNYLKSHSQFVLHLTNFCLCLL
jgi:hypothetical protein